MQARSSNTPAIFFRDQPADIPSHTSRSDDDDSRDFSKGLAQQYVEQAAETFDSMDEALCVYCCIHIQSATQSLIRLVRYDRSAKDLDRLSKLGHFLKGSSASIGLVSVSKNCAAMQNYGSCKDEAGTSNISSEDALKNCTDLIPKLKVEQTKAKKWLEEFYKEKW